MVFLFPGDQGGQKLNDLGGGRELLQDEEGGDSAVDGG